jgi:hypothetical protein
LREKNWEYVAVSVFAEVADLEEIAAELEQLLLVGQVAGEAAVAGRVEVLQVEPALAKN